VGTRVIPAPIDLLGVPIHPVSQAQLLDTLVSWGRGTTLRRVYYINIHGMNLAHEDDAYRRALHRGDVVFCDGYGVKWGARLAGSSLPERMTPPDWIDRFAAATAAAGQSVFALGDEDGVAARFQRQLTERHPGYRDAGHHHGFFAKTGAENAAVLARINAASADHLLVGFGMPLQELWTDANASRLRVKTVISVGALFRWYSGEERRGPPWMTEHGFEWLARLAQHPVRHFRRYVVGNPLFLYRILRWRTARASR
jgi:N-acetylglucosaminyldiphosphoundecaprenol N-acetyl-beta-D-mannosaminyltransferase